MKDRDIIIIKKMFQYCYEIEEAMKMFNSDYKTFKTSSIFQNACCMCILQIGELAKVVSVELKEMYDDIPWKEWCGIRDIFAHQYSSLDITSVWDTVVKDVPKLQRTCEQIIKHSKK